MARGPRRAPVPLSEGAERIDGDFSVVVAGGGIAGVAAATVLAERGARVTIIERESFLGGRAGAWTDHLSTGESFQMERGFHAFFRQYYNLHALLRRIDPELSFLHRLDDYPIHGPDGEEQSFQGLPRSTPANLITLTAQFRTNCPKYRRIAALKTCVKKSALTVMGGHGGLLIGAIPLWRDP